MKKVEKFCCEFCNKEYRTESDAKRCEENHKTPVEITKVKHRPCDEDHSGYPLQINVKMSDGKTIGYVRG